MVELLLPKKEYAGRPVRIQQFMITISFTQETLYKLIETTIAEDRCNPTHITTQEHMQSIALILPMAI